MRQIRLRSLGQTCSDAVEAVMPLHDARNADDDTFLRAAWRMAQVIAPVGSEPLSYLLDRINCEQYGFEPIQRRIERILSDTPNRGGAVRVSSASLEDDARKLKAILREELSGAHNLDAPDDPWRRFFWHELTLRFQHTEPSVISDVWVGENADDVVHLGAFCMFHLADIGKFAREMTEHPDFCRLSPFWKAFIRWHAGHRGVGMTRLLRKIIRDRRHVSAGKRKAALLLLLTDSTVSPRTRIQTVKGFPRYLLRQEIEYAGSPPLPVRVCPSLTLSKRERADVLREIADQKTPDVERGKLVQELLGAYAENSPILTDVPRIRKAARMLVHGGCEGERRTTALALAAIGGCAEDDCREWDRDWVADAENVATLRREVNSWADDGKFLSYLASLTAKAMLATELQKWSDDASSILAKLVRRHAGGRFWDKKVIGCRDLFSAATLKDSPASKELSQDFVAAIPALCDRRDDVPQYIDAICEDEVKRFAATGPQGQTPSTPVTWHVPAKKAIVDAMEQWPLLATTPDVLVHIVKLVNAQSGPSRTVTKVTVEAVLCQEDVPSFLKTGTEEPKKTTPTEAETEENLFRRNGDVWEVIFKERKLKLLKHRKGYSFIAYLLQRPGEEITNLELLSKCDVLSPKPPRNMGTDASEDADGSADEDKRPGDSAYSKIDKATSDAYLNHLSELRTKKDKAKKERNYVLVDELTKECDAIVEQLREAISKSGKLRKISPEMKKVRDKVSIGIERAIDAIEKEDKELGQYLRKTLRLTYPPCYLGPLQWVI